MSTIKLSFMDVSHACRTQALSHDDMLENVVAQTQASFLTFESFFVAWSGVLCIAFQGWPQNLVTFKHHLQAIPGLRKENNGSMFPKCTIACLNDNTTLTSQQYVALSRICKEAGDSLRRMRRQLQQVYIARCSACIFQVCSLESNIVSKVYNFDASTNIGSGIDDVPAQERERVQIILEECDSDAYYDKVIEEGHRISHYQTPRWGATLVSFIQDSMSDEFENCIKEFRNAIVKEFGAEMYCFFDTSALHVTIR